jgi:hypothetical protein
MNRIELRFKPATVALAGNPYGRKEFNNQVKPKLNQDKQITLVFPDQIIYITSSFIQGFFDYWLRTIGIENMRKNITVQTTHDNLTAYIWKNLQ